MDALDDWENGNSFDEAVLMDRPTQVEVAKVLEELTGSKVTVDLGYNMYYVKNFILKFATPESPETELSLHMTVDSWVDEKDTPYRGLVSSVSSPRNDVTLEIMKRLARHFGGWTRRTQRTLVNRKLAPGTTEWEFHANAEKIDPALNVELKMEKLFHSFHTSAIYALMQDKEKLDTLIETLVQYRDATKNGVGRLPGSGERTREQERFNEQNRRRKSGI
jgi:hypothetical protein